jgi:hypothetical protein
VVKRGGELLLPGVYPAPARHSARYPPFGRRLPSSMCRVLLSMLEAVEGGFCLLGMVEVVKGRCGRGDSETWRPRGSLVSMSTWWYGGLGVSLQAGRHGGPEVWRVCCRYGDVEARRSGSLKGRYQSLLMESQHGYRTEQQECKREGIEAAVRSGGGSKV